MEQNQFSNPEYFTNRELSWLQFNLRVLKEARDKTIPLFDRLKFLSITASNLDEFFMIRVASLKDMVHAGYEKKDFSGRTPKEQLQEISISTHELVELQYSTFNRIFLPLLRQKKIKIYTKFEDLSNNQQKYADSYFESDVYPVLTPMAVDSSRPFPLIRNQTLNIAALINDSASETVCDFATVQVPDVLPRLIEIPSSKDNVHSYILLEQIIEMNIQKLFLNYKVISAFPYRIMRNADLPIDEDEAADLLAEIEKQLKKRQWGEAIRLETEDGIDKRLLKRLKQEFHIKETDVYKISGPLDLTFLMKLYGKKGYSELKCPAYEPQPVQALSSDESLFEQIQKKDILLFHPYYSFEPVVDFIRQASVDKNVLAIKQTLYRVSSNSPIISFLAQAAENGKQVTVLVELKARFDEENNILWAKKLEKAGCHVIYGLVGLKTHCKITLVVRREDHGIRRYVHLGTGNYNDSTARLYTDMGIFTCSNPIGEDATAVFNMLSGYSQPLHWNKLALAPLWLRNKFLELIKRETMHAASNRPAHIIAKMNSLCDRQIIQSLYEASAAGVKIDLIVRGICCLKPGIPEVSQNITVRSIVGNFLEHARIFYFSNNGFPEIYMGSADWMPRNLDKRVEILFPVDNPDLKNEILTVLKIQLEDTIKAHILQSDGTYDKPDRRGKKSLNSQDYFCNKAQKETKEQKKGKQNQQQIFQPIKSTN